MSLAHHVTQMHVLSNAHSLPLVARWSVTFAVLVTKWDSRRRTRRHLNKLSDDLLRDIGLDRFTAQAETAKPFWQD